LDASSEAVNISNVSNGRLILIREQGAIVIDVAMPVSFGQNLNIETGGNNLNLDSVIMNEGFFEQHTQ